MRVYAAGERALYRSDDGGQTWQASAQGLPDGGIQALALDPRQPERLVAAASSGAFYISEDGADSWQALTGAVAHGGT
jgi:photosystem II stability/assembly factor-like uncharacterized protein